MAADLARLEQALGHVFTRRRLLEEAVTHSSANHGGKRISKAAVNYQRLEFLGDRVLGLLVAEMLLAAFPGEAEGALARRFTDLVRQETLASVGNLLELGLYVRLPPTGDAATRANPALLADLCEAVVAAIYQDGGFAAAKAFVSRHWMPLIEAQTMVPIDPKTALQEWAQARAQALPVYRVVRSSGPPHRPIFTVEVQLTGCAPVEGIGSSKRLAEIAAASGMLERITQPAEAS